MGRIPYRPPSPPKIAKTPEEILSALEEGEGGSFASTSIVTTPAVPGATAAITPAITPATATMLGAVEKLPTAAEVSEIVANLFAQAGEVFSIYAINPKRFGGLSPYETLLHPAVIRQAARSGAVFYYAADKQVHSFKLSNEERQSLKSIDGQPATGIDPGFFLAPPWLDDLKRFVDADQTVLLIGPAGSGKSETTEQVFKLRAQSLHVVSCTPTTTADDLEGRTDLVGGETKFTLATPALAVRDGHGLLLDEADAAPAEACYSLYRCLDGKDMRITRMGGEGIIPRHPGFRAVGTQNTHGRGDDRGLHHGRSYQDEAFLDRWDQAIKVDYPAKENEILILRKRTGITAAAAENVIASAAALRQALHSDEIMVVCSIRRTLAVAENLTTGMSPERAWQFALINRVSEEDAAKVREVLQRIYGDRLKKPTPT